MTLRLASLILGGGILVLGAACATKDFVQQQVSAVENKVSGRMTAMQTDLSRQMTATHTELTERAKLQETKLRETADRGGESRRAIDAAAQRLDGLDARVGEVGAVASGARTRADSATASAQDAEARLAQRLAGRNNYRLVDTKSLYFGSGQIDIQGPAVKELEELAAALAKDPNAILELQGFADSQGSDRYNRELARERVEVVIRHLVQRHGIGLRQLQAVSMGPMALGPGEKASSQTLARARRVDIRLLTPWSSWEDAQARIDRTPAEQTATGAPVPPAPGAPTPPAPATIAGLPDQPEPSLLPLAAQDDPPTRRLPELLKTITPRDLGAE